MRRLSAAALCAVLLLALDGASAQTLSSANPALGNEVRTRLGALTGKLTKDQKKQKSAMTKAAKAIDAETDDVTKTLTNVGKAVAAIDPVFATDPAFGQLLDQMINLMGSVADQRRGALDQSIAVLPDGKAKAAVQKSAVKADDANAAIGLATTRKARVKALQTKFAAIVAGEKQVAKAGAGIVASTVLDVNVEKDHLHMPGLLPFVYSASYSALSNKFTLQIDCTLVQTRRHISIDVASPGVGPHDVTVGASSTYSALPAVGNLPATSGSMTFTAWDPDHGKAAGSFSATFSDGTTTVHLTSGTFTSIAVQLRP